MTIDERAAACAGEVGTSYEIDETEAAEIIARHLREAVAERDAELRAENERLRERVIFHAKARLKLFVAVGDEAFPFATDEIWKMACSGQASFLLELAEEAGVWLDDDGNEVPLDKWRARMGGAG